MASAAVQTLKDIIPAIGDEDKHVRYEALKNLCEVMDNGKLEPGVLAEHAHHIVPRLEDEDSMVRLHAVEALGKLEPGVLAEYAGDINLMLEDENWEVCCSAFQVLGQLEPGVLAKYADDIVPRLEDECFCVRWSAVRALSYLEPGVLAKYAHHIVTKLEDKHYMVRSGAVRAVENVPLVALVPRRYALQSLEHPRIKMLRGRVWLVRWRQLFWGQRLLWWWGSLACKPGSRQAIAAASEFGRMQGVSAEEEGEREVKRARVV